MYVHQAAGIYDFGDDTGCAKTAPKLKEVVQEISDWLNLQENKRELLYIKMETFVGSNVRCFSVAPVATGFDASFAAAIFDLIAWCCCSKIGFHLQVAEWHKYNLLVISISNSQTLTLISRMLRERFPFWNYLLHLCHIGRARARDKQANRSRPVELQSPPPQLAS